MHKEAYTPDFYFGSAGLVLMPEVPWVQMGWQVLPLLPQTLRRLLQHCPGWLWNGFIMVNPLFLVQQAVP